MFLLEIFAFGTMWFWILLALFAFIVMIEIANEYITASAVTIALFIVLMFLCGNFTFTWIKENPTTLLSILGIYLVGGVVVSAIKWAFWSRDAKDHYDEIKTEYIKRNKLGIPVSAVIPPENRADFRDFLEDRVRSTKIDPEFIIPQVGKNKELVITWMAFWPWIAFWSLFSDVFRRIWIETFRAVQKVYQSFSNLMFRNALADLVIVPVEVPANDQPSSNNERDLRRS